MAIIKEKIIDRKYIVGGKTLPSVTEILSAAGIRPTYTSEEAAERGTLVHRACAAYDLGYEPEVEPWLEPYYQAYLKFIEEVKPEVVLVETPVYHETHGYAGTLDRVFEIQGKRWICDIKTGSVPDWAPIQMAAYSACLPRPIWDRMALNLKSDGTYKQVNYDPRESQRDFSVFLAALTIWRWKNR